MICLLKNELDVIERRTLSPSLAAVIVMVVRRCIT